MDLLATRLGENYRTILESAAKSIEGDIKQDLDLVITSISSTNHDLAHLKAYHDMTQQHLDAVREKRLQMQHNLRKTSSLISRKLDRLAELHHELDMLVQDETEFVHSLTTETWSDGPEKGKTLASVKQEIANLEQEALRTLHHEYRKIDRAEKIARRKLIVSQKFD